MKLKTKLNKLMRRKEPVNLLKEIYDTHNSWKKAEPKDKQFYETYVQVIIGETPQEQQDNYFIYWDALKRHGGCLKKDWGSSFWVK